MEWYANEWCVTLEELTRDDRTGADQSEHLAPIVNIENYKKMSLRGKLKVVRQGKGKGNYALISYASLPEAMQAKLKAKYPDLIERQQREKNPAYELFRRAYERDYEALSYYHKTLRELNKSLSKERIAELAEEYTINASVIQAVIRVRRDNELYRKVRGRSRAVSWADMSDVIKYYQAEYGHTLGASPTRFAQWVRKYEQEGYAALISKKFGNMNTLKMSIDVEKLLLTIAKDPHQPYGVTVWEQYQAFQRGELDFFEEETGELIAPQGYPELSERTVVAKLKNPKFRALLSKHHNPRHDYMTVERPHHWRKKPQYSLSMISIDDKDFTVKVTAKGLKHPTSLKGYWAFDVASGAVVGWAFGIKKDTNLFLACVRSMYRNLLDWGLGQPFEAQVENHLVSTFRETMMKSGHLFPVVTFAGAENSQEKYAERNFHYFKHGVEKDNIVGVGRHYGRNRANRVRGKKVSDSTNENYEQNVYAFEKAEAVYTHLVHLYNDELHPDQKRYPGKTRLEVLKTCVHPTKIKPIDMMSLALWAGWSRDTSIVRGVIHADNEVYIVPHHYLDALKQGSNKVTARWWRQSDEGSVEQMYLYQEDVYLGIHG